MTGKHIFEFEDSASDRIARIIHFNDDFQLNVESDNSGSTDLIDSVRYNNVFTSPAIAVGDFFHIALVLYTNNVTVPEFYINGIEKSGSVGHWDADGGGLSAINRLFIGPGS